MDGALLRALARVRLEFYIIFCTSLAYVGSVLLASQTSLNAVAGTMLGIAVVSIPIRTVLIRRATGIDGFLELRRGLPILFAAIAMGGTVALWRLMALPYLSGPHLLASSVVVGVIGYVGMIALLDRQAIRESVGMLRAGGTSEKFEGRSPET